MTPRPRAKPAPEPLFHVVLHQPEIPNNTGNIGRTCVASGCALHLIRPLGFDTDEKACRRAGLDYWPRLNVTEHDSWPAFLAAARPQRLWLFTTRATTPVFSAAFRRGDSLVFGQETRGLPPDLLAQYPDQLLTIPMVPAERSLNLAVSVGVAVYEGLRQLTAHGELSFSPGARLAPPPPPIG
jgi:tRNA (cytidine/uridine-2'-O-)-methyltransferase